MNRDDFQERVNRDINRLINVLERSKSMENGRLYKYNNTLGRLIGFVYSDLSCGVRMQVLANRTFIYNKSETLQFAGYDFEPVPDSDLPLYMGWKTTSEFGRHLKRRPKNESNS